MTREEIISSQEYKANKAALNWWYSLPEEQRKATDIDAEPDIVDAYAEGVIYGWNNPNWISVEERLPLISDEFIEEQLSVDVLVTDGEVFEVSFYDYKNKMWQTAMDGFITHWMEIQPPKKEE